MVADGRPIVADVVRFQGPPEQVERTLVSTAKRDGERVRIDLPQDPGQAGKSQVQYFTRLLGGYRVTSSPESGSKTLRAEPFAAQVNVGNVSMVRGAWNAALVDEMRSFPVGAHDDQVDAMSRAQGHLTSAVEKAVDDPAITAVGKGWTEVFETILGVSDTSAVKNADG